MKIIKGDVHGNITILRKPDSIKDIGKKKAMYITGGEFAITYDIDEVPIATMLGSCVAVMLYDNVLKIKGMNHFLLPGAMEKGMSLRYGLNAMEMMMNEMYKLGVQKENLVAKIAGGATIFQNFKDKIGERNVEFARMFCLKEKIQVLSEHVFGNHGRAVVLDSDFQTIARTFQNTLKDRLIIEEEKVAQEQLLNKMKSCEIYSIWEREV